MADSDVVPTLPGAAQKKYTDYGALPPGILEKSIYEPFNPYGTPPPPPPPWRRKKGFIIGIVTAVIIIPLLILSSFGVYSLLVQRASTPSGGLVKQTSATVLPKTVSTAATSPKPSPVASVMPSLVSTATASVITQPACGGAFSDNFQGSLHAGWSWVDPARHGTYSVGGAGILTITTSGNSDLNAASNDFAPRILQPIQKKFALETLVELPTNPSPGFLAAGILLWQDDGNFLRLERSTTTFDFEQEVNGVFSHDDPQSLAAATISAPQAGLQLKRSGDSFTASWRLPGQAWQFINTTNVHFQHIQVGLFLVNQTTAQVTAAYHYFKVVCG